MEGDGPPGVGTRYTTTRRIAGIVRTDGNASKITELRPPRSWAARGAGGPVRETIKYTVEPLGENVGSRVTIELDFEGRGSGRLLVPLVVRRQARNEMPINCRKLKERLESGDQKSNRPVCGRSIQASFRYAVVRGGVRATAPYPPLEMARRGLAWVPCNTIVVDCLVRV
jgi:hypothetical protein